MTIRALLAALLFFLYGCTAQSVGDAEPVELLVGAAASTVNVVGELAREFEKTNPGVKVSTHFAASGTILHQLEQGSALDIFLFADRRSVDLARERNIGIVLVEAVATNTLVFAAKAGTGGEIHDSGYLLDVAIEKVCVGNPDFVPLGRYSREALAALGLWQRLADKLIFANSAAQASQYLVSGEVDAALLYGSDLTRLGEKIQAVEELKLPTPPRYFAGVVGGRPNEEVAKSFVKFLLTERAQAILTAHGFSSPGGES